jgi:hypothetical protein
LSHQIKECLFPPTFPPNLGIVNPPLSATDIIILEQQRLEAQRIAQENAAQNARIQQENQRIEMERKQQAMQVAQMRTILQAQQAEAERQRQAAAAEQQAKAQELAAQYAANLAAAQVEAYNAQLKWDKAFEASRVKAASIYDFVANPQGPEHARMLQINSQWKAENNPLFSDSNRPMLIAEIVAKEFGIKPTSSSP